MDELDCRIINRLQDGFPICERPYLAVAQELDLDEETLLARVRKLLDEGLLSRFGPMFNAERLGGGLSLVAMRVPPEQLQQVAEQVNAFPQVAHNYAREHEFNLWFVLATETPGEIADTLQAIEADTGYPTYNMPKQEEFYVGFRFQL